MSEASFFLSGLPRKLHYEWFGFPRTECAQRLFNFFQIGELVKPRTARANLTDRLRTAQHQHSQSCNFGRREMHDFRHDVFVFRDAAGAAVKYVSEILLAQTE